MVHTRGLQNNEPLFDLKGPEVGACMTQGLAKKGPSGIKAVMTPGMACSLDPHCGSHKLLRVGEQGPEFLGYRTGFGR